jgi:hypothetical protein
MERASMLDQEDLPLRSSCVWRDNHTVVDINVFSDMLDHRGFGVKLTSVGAHFGKYMVPLTLYERNRNGSKQEKRARQRYSLTLTFRHVTYLSTGTSKNP